ncbi:TPA: hypothetical protein N3N52_004795 [Klebsiella pneumoniae]|nr:hypothetical protein [Klebsiella pneumoniae]
MTTDITELAQRVEHIISDMKLKHGDKDTYAPVMKWDEFLALVKALEKAQRYIEELREWNAGLAQESFERQQRIAEMESRTVKLPDLRQMVSGDRYVWSDGVYNYSQDVKVVLAAAGIKVEGE